MDFADTKQFSFDNKVNENSFDFKSLKMKAKITEVLILIHARFHLQKKQSDFFFKLINSLQVKKKLKMLTLVNKNIDKEFIKQLKKVV